MKRLRIVYKLNTLLLILLYVTLFCKSESLHIIEVVAIADSITKISSTGDSTNLTHSANNLKEEPPVAVADSYSGFIETTITVDSPGVLINDTSSQGEPLVAILDSGPEHGTLSLALDGSFTYTPAAGYVGTDFFSYYANDGNSTSQVVTVTLFISPAPSNLPVNGGFELGNPANFGSLYGWIVSGTQFGYLADSAYPATEGGRLVVFGGGSEANDGVISQTFSTTAGQLYVVEFDLGVFGTSGIKQLLQVRVNGTNNTLVDKIEELSSRALQNQWIASWVDNGMGYSFIADGGETTITFSDASGSLPVYQRVFTDLLLDNVRVREAQPSTLSVNSAPIGGVGISISQPDLDERGSGTTGLVRSYANGTVLTLTAPATSSGNIFKTWQVNGIDTLPGETAITLKVSGDGFYTAVYEIGQAPSARSDFYSTVEGLRLKVPAPGVLSNDGDLSTTERSVRVDSYPAHGVVVLLADGSFIYSPEPGFVGEDSFAYRANNGGDESAPATVHITVEPVGAFLNGSFESGAPFPEPYSWKFNLEGWMIDGNPFGYEADPPNYIPLEGNGVRMAVFNGGDDDFSGCITQRFLTKAGQEYELAFDLGIFGPAGNTQRLLITIGDGVPIEGEAVASGDGTFWAVSPKRYRFIAENNATTLRFSDASGALPSILTGSTDLILDNVSVTEVTSVNGPPVFLARPITTPDATQDLPYNGSLTDSASDPDAGDTLAFSKISGPEWLQIASDGALSGTPVDSDVGLNSFTVQVTDAAGGFDQATLKITVGVRDGFKRWMGEHGLLGSPEHDSDGDSIINALEYVFGGNPTEPDELNLLPTVKLVSKALNGASELSEYVVFTYRLTDRAKNDFLTTIQAEWTATLPGPWTVAEEAQGIVFAVDEDGAGPGVALVHVYLPRSQDMDGKLFLRLGVSITTP